MAPDPPSRSLSRPFGFGQGPCRCFALSPVASLNHVMQSLFLIWAALSMPTSNQVIVTSATVRTLNWTSNTRKMLINYARTRDWNPY